MSIAKPIREIVSHYPSHRLSRENEIFLHPAWRHHEDNTWTVREGWKLVGWSPSPPVPGRKSNPHAIVYEHTAPDEIPGIAPTHEREGLIFQGAHVWVHGDAEKMLFRQPTKEELDEAAPWLGMNPNLS